MKKHYKLTINEPCSENWRNFRHTNSGGYCKVCEKNVLDFTKKSDEDIYIFFQSKPGKICGRFRPDQIKVYSDISKEKKKRYGLVKAAIALVAFLFTPKEGDAQSNTTNHNIEIVDHGERNSKLEKLDEEFAIKGTVVGEDNYPIPGANVVIKGSIIGTVTDINGNYELTVKEGDILVFSFIGFVTEEHIVKEIDSGNIKMQMMMWDIMGEVAIDEVYSSKRSMFSSLWKGIKRIF